MAQYKRGESGNRRGRPKGSQNKLTKNAKEAFEFAFDEIGGPEKLAEWAENNRRDFYRIYARLLPRDVTLKGDSPVSIQVVAYGGAKKKETSKHG